MPLYHSYVVTFCIWYLYFVYGKNKQTNKQKLGTHEVPTRKNFTTNKYPQEKILNPRWYDETRPTRLTRNLAHSLLAYGTLFACLWHTPYLLMAHSLLAYGTLLTRLCPRPTMTHDPMNSAQSYSRLIMRLFHLFHLNKFKDSLLSYFLTKGNLWKAHWGVSFKHPKL